MGVWITEMFLTKLLVYKAVHLPLIHSRIHVSTDIIIWGFGYVKIWITVVQISDFLLDIDI